MKNQENGTSAGLCSQHRAAHCAHFLWVLILALLIDPIQSQLGDNTIEKATSLYNLFKEQQEQQYGSRNGTYYCKPLNKAHKEQARDRLVKRFKDIHDHLEATSSHLIKQWDGTNANGEEVEYCKDKKYVEWDKACILTKMSNSHQISSIANALITRPKRGQDVVVFTSLEGDTVISPSMPSEGTDDAIEQWHMGTLVSKPKDIVILVDTSKVMRDDTSKLASGAIGKILTRMSPKDRLALMTFPNNGSGDSSELSFVTSKARESFKNFLARLSNTNADYQVHDIRLAFDMFNKSRKLPMDRGKILLLFLGQSFMNQSQWNSIKEAIMDNNKDQSNKIQVMGVAVGPQDQGNTTQNFKELAKHFLIQKHFNLNDSTESSFQATFHDYLLYIYKETHLVHTVSLFTRNVSMIHSCELIHHTQKGKKVGKVCLLTPRAFIEHDINIPDTLDSYGFIIDSNGEIIYHKHVNPKAWAGNKVHFENVENVDASGKLFEDILRIGDGLMETKQKRVIRRQGTTYLDGFILREERKATYMCSKINDTTLTFCLVAIYGDCLLDMSRERRSGSFQYHNANLTEGIYNHSCVCHKQQAYCSEPSWDLQKDAFLDPPGPFSISKERVLVEGMTKYMDDEGSMEQIRPESRSVYWWLTDFFQWKDTGSIFKWQYGYFLHGVFFIYPGIQLPNYNPKQDWYLGGLASPEVTTLIFSTPRKDEFEGGTEPVITISTPFYLKLDIASMTRNPTQPKEGEKDMDTRVLLGVYALDLSLDRFKNLTKLTFNMNNAFIMNNVGYLIYHWSFEKTNAKIEKVHIMEREPTVGKKLEEELMILKRQRCINVMTGEKKIWFKVDPSEVDNKCRPNEVCVFRFSGTNLYIVQFSKNLTWVEEDKDMPGDEPSIADKSTRIFNDNPCNKGSDECPLCPPDLWPPDHEEEDTRDKRAEGGRCPLKDIECEMIHDKGLCDGFGYAGCNWCQDKSSPDGHCHPSKCPSQEVSTIQNPTEPAPKDRRDTAMLIITSLLTLVVGVVITLVCFLVIRSIRRRCLLERVADYPPGPKRDEIDGLERDAPNNIPPHPTDSLPRSQPDGEQYTSMAHGATDRRSRGSRGRRPSQTLVKGLYPYIPPSETSPKTVYGRHNHSREPSTASSYMAPSESTCQSAIYQMINGRKCRLRPDGGWELANDIESDSGSVSGPNLAELNRMFQDGHAVQV